MEKEKIIEILNKHSSVDFRYKREITEYDFCKIADEIIEESETEKKELILYFLNMLQDIYIKNFIYQDNGMGLFKIIFSDEIRILEKYSGKEIEELIQ